MRIFVILLALFFASTMPAFAGISPSTGASAAAQSGAKIAPKQDQETKNHENHNSQPDSAK